jgi:serine/threonine protein kinase
MAEIICPKCKATNKDAAGYCSECGASLSTSPSSYIEVQNHVSGLQTGSLLQDRYRIVKELGRGGFGAVYRSWDTRLSKAVAVKENLETSPEAQRQFAREALVLASLSHPNLPRVTDHFSLPNQGQYLVMDFVEGEDLETRVLTQGVVPVEQALAWIIQVADALEYLHGQSPPVIHRDIKPANIRITPGGKAMLVDFGLVKVSAPNLMTTQGARAISPGYAPPEQYGQGRTDARTDIYGLSSTLYRLVTGCDPTESVRRISGDAQLSVEQVNTKTPRQLSQAIERGMALDPIDRYQSAKEFKTVLKNLLVGAQSAGDGISSSTIERGQASQTQPIISSTFYPMVGQSGKEETVRTKIAGSESQTEDKRKIAVTGAPLIGQTVIEQSLTGSGLASGGTTSSGSGLASGGAAQSVMGQASGGAVHSAGHAAGGIHGGMRLPTQVKLFKIFPRWLVFSCTGGVAAFTLLVIAVSVIAIISSGNSNKTKPTEIPNTVAAQVTGPSTPIAQDVVHVQASPTFQGKEMQSTAAVVSMSTAVAPAVVVGPVSGPVVVVPTPSNPSLPVDQAVVSFLTSLGVNAIPELIYGPESGSLIHDPANRSLEGKCTSIETKNFMLQVLFSVPGFGSNGIWDFGTMFRMYNNGDLRVVVFNDKNWKYIQHKRGPDEYMTIEEGNVRKLGINKGDTNLLQFVAMDDVGWLYVNNVKATKLNISENLNPGAVCIALGFFNNTEITGEETPFTDFTVWELR